MNRTTQLGASSFQTASRWRGGPPSPSIFPYIQVEIPTHMFYPRQNSVQTLYFALGTMEVVGTADIGGFLFQIQPTAKSATASL